MAPRVFSDTEIIEAYRKSFPAIGPGNYFEIFEVGPSSLGNEEYGLGLFAGSNTKFEEGKPILVYKGTTNIDMTDCANQYVIGDENINGDPKEEDINTEASIASYINDGCFCIRPSKQNAKYYRYKIPNRLKDLFSEYKNGYLILIVALRNIEPGEEILVDYGNNYWDTVYENKIVDMMDWGVACCFLGRVYLGTILFDQKYDWFIIWSDADNGMPQILGDSTRRDGSINYKKMYDKFMALHRAGAGVFYEPEKRMKNPLIGKKIKYNGKKCYISDITETEKHELQIQISENGKAEEPQIKINFVDFSKNIQKNKIKILDNKNKNHKDKELKVPKPNQEPNVYKFSDACGCEKKLVSKFEQKVLVGNVIEGDIECDVIGDVAGVVVEDRQFVEKASESSSLKRKTPDSEISLSSDKRLSLDLSFLSSKKSKSNTPMSEKSTPSQVSTKSL